MKVKTFKLVLVTAMIGYALCDVLAEPMTTGLTQEVLVELECGKLDEVKARIARATDPNSPETWAMKLALADSYHAFGKDSEAKGIYDGFFKQYENDVPEAMDTLYSDSAYKYAQMLCDLKERLDALKMYKRLLAHNKKQPEHIERQCLAEMAEITLSLANDENDTVKRDALLKEVDAWADKLLCRQDLWFGKAIVLKAHVLMLDHKYEEAKKLVNDFLPTLTAIHQALVEQETATGEPLTRISPMAECRYSIAVMLQAEAERLIAEEDFSVNNTEKREEVLALLLGAKGDGKRKGDGAYNHFLNVFLQYPESNWAADAGERAEAVRAILVDTFGGNVKASVTEEQMTRVRQIQFRDARALFAQGQIDKARNRLIQVLNAFPNCPEAIPALGDLARCYMRASHNTNALLQAQSVIEQLAERFCENNACIQAAGDELIRLAENWLEYGLADKRLQTYALFFRLYPGHSSCPIYLASFGEKAYQNKDYASALSYFGAVANNYTNSQCAFDSLSRIVTIYEEKKDFANAIIAVSNYVNRLEAAGEQGDAQAQCRLGVCYEFGQGVEKDIEKAVQWYRKAAEQGLAQAQCHLGVCYQFGKGVEKDATKAVVWYHKAAEQGLARAQWNLGMCYRFTGVEKDAAKAFEWFSKAAEQGFANAQFNLGLSYEVGMGVEHDYAKAVEWYRKAAKQGDSQGIEALQRIASGK